MITLSLGHYTSPTPSPFDDEPQGLGDAATGHREQSSSYRLGGTEYMDVVFLALQNLFTVTGTNETSGHNPNSTHYRGLSADLRTWDKTPDQVSSMMNEARLQGFSVRDERSHPQGQAVWTGSHLHITEYPRASHEYHLSDIQSEGSNYHLLDLRTETSDPVPLDAPAIPQPEQEQDLSPGGIQQPANNIELRRP